ncbi:MAG: tetratricopeptide repeat protein [Parvibaculum sp.]|uniref:tetratricopeptide repeat protein n=1 Tax=Parvibaculum sp. TaxID=2024848 RepID=UPI0034A06AA7
MVYGRILLLAAAFLAWAPLSATADAIGDSNLCYAQFSTGDNKAAIDYCSRAIESGELDEPDLIAALINRGVAYKNVGDLVAAVNDYTRALTIAPRDALLYQNRANALREMDEFDAALADVEQAIEIDPDRAAAWYVRGAINEAQGERDAAREDYRKALSLDPENEAYKEKFLGMNR